jgi:hypothetical protein
MNRNEHLASVIDSWIAIADEIVICDWSSSERVLDTIWPQICAHGDKIRVVEVVGKSRWQLSPAFNLAARYARGEVLLKLDCDDEVTPDFASHHPMQPGVFYCGDWSRARHAQETYLNGVVMCWRADFARVGGYNEYITTYGWDDSDLYNRLDAVATRRAICNDTLRHLPHESRSDRDTFVEIHYNRMLCSLAATSWCNVAGSAGSAGSVNVPPLAVYKPTARTRIHSAAGSGSAVAYRYLAGRATVSAIVPPAAHAEATRRLHEFLRIARPDRVNELCLVLQNGLGNKLRALASGISLYRWLQTACKNRLPWKLVVVWPVDEHCGAKYSDLFTLESLTCGGDPAIEFVDTVPAVYAHGAVAIRAVNTAATGKMDTGAVMSGLHEIRCNVVGAITTAQATATATAQPQPATAQAVATAQPPPQVPATAQPQPATAQAVATAQPPPQVPATALPQQPATTAAKSNFTVVSTDATATAASTTSPSSFDGVVNSTTPNKIYIESATVIEFPLRNWNSDCEYLRKLAPISAIADTIAQLEREILDRVASAATSPTRRYTMRDLVGFHIRIGTQLQCDNITDWPQDKQESWKRWRAESQYEKFRTVMQKLGPVDAAGFYIASDSPEIYARAEEDFPGRVFYFARNCNDRSREQVVTGLVDAVMLSRTKKVYGSNWSSFTELAARLGGSCLYAGKDF